MSIQLTQLLNNIFNIHKDIFACLFSIHNTISLSCHEQVCLSGLRFERYFSHHRAGSKKVVCYLLYAEVISFFVTKKYQRIVKIGESS